MRVSTLYLVRQLEQCSGENFGKEIQIEFQDKQVKILPIDHIEEWLEYDIRQYLVRHSGEYSEIAFVRPAETRKKLLKNSSEID